MDSTFFKYTEILNQWLWNYCGIPIILLFGVYLAYVSRLILLRNARTVGRIFLSSFATESAGEKAERGLSPIRTFFASVSGCIGLENVVSVCAAIQVGGPGAIFWMWIAIGLGMLIKYAEIYLSFVNRIPNDQEGYLGGPIYYLRKIGDTQSLQILFCFMMCIYATDIYTFRIATSTMVVQWGLNKLMVVFGFLGLIIFAGARGFDRLGKIAEILIPIFTMTFIGLCFWVFVQHWKDIPGVFVLIFKSAFSGHAVIGGFAGSGIWLGMVEGMKKACYIGDIGIGYAGIIHSESKEQDPCKEAILGMMGIFLDAFFFCTMSVLLILVTGIWHEQINERELVVTALGRYVPYVGFIWPLFIMMLGYSTLVAYYAVSKKVVESLLPKWGKRLHMIFVVTTFTIFSFVGTEAHLMTIVSMSGLVLLMINMYAIIRLRKDISFTL